MKIVVAHFNEDLAWVRRVDKKHEVIVLEKLVPSIGRDLSTHLFYILTNYATMSGTYVFLQGDPFYHHPWLNSDLETHTYYGWNMAVPNDGTHDCTDLRRCDRDAGTVEETLAIFRFPRLKKFIFRQGCQFKMDADTIRTIPYPHLAKAFGVSFLPGGTYALELILALVYPPLVKALMNQTLTTPSRRPDEPWVYHTTEDLLAYERIAESVMNAKGYLW